MRVREITNEKHPFIYEDELATKARALIRDFSLRILPVTDGNKKVLGQVSRSNVMTISSSVSPIRVKGIMANPKHIAAIGDDAFSAIKEMIKTDEWNIPVVNTLQEKIYFGVLGLENFIEALIKTSPEKLAKPVSEIMSQNVLTCSPEDEVDNIWRVMQTKGLAGLPVVRRGKLVGMITQKDFIDSGAILPTFESAKGRFRTPSKISSLMKTNIIVVQPHIKTIRVAKVMAFKNIGRVPVIDKEGKLVGIVDREDVARVYAK